jgi:hypothetical protein
MVPPMVAGDNEFDQARMLGSWEKEAMAWSITVTT